MLRVQQDKARQGRNFAKAEDPGDSSAAAETSSHTDQSIENTDDQLAHWLCFSFAGAYLRECEASHIMRGFAEYISEQSAYQGA